MFSYAKKKINICWKFEKHVKIHFENLFTYDFEARKHSLLKTNSMDHTSFSETPLLVSIATYIGLHVSGYSFIFILVS